MSEKQKSIQIDLLHVITTMRENEPMEETIPGVFGLDSDRAHDLIRSMQGEVANSLGDAGTYTEMFANACELTLKYCDTQEEAMWMLFHMLKTFFRSFQGNPLEALMRQMGGPH